MSAVVLACLCGSVTAEPIQCPEHFHLFKGGKRLKSVGSIIRETFPMDPGIPADVLENARDRGEETDRLFADWLRGKLDRIPAGTRHDAKALFGKLVNWFRKEDFSRVEVQIVAGCDDHGGVADLLLDGEVFELKATYSIEHTHRLQAAAYGALLQTNAHILHVTERFDAPKEIQLKQEDYADWDTLLAHWRMVQRRNHK